MSAPESRSPRWLRAGPVSALLEGGDLRRVRLGGREALRRICVAVRDADWDTVAPERGEDRIEAGGDRFRASYEARYRQRELDLSARVEMEGGPDGRLHLTFDALANADFPYCRMGICVLHPPSAAGRRYRSVGPDGATEGRLPELVGPQWMREGRLHALFPPFRHLALQTAEGLDVELDFEGDLFEMEDQRNWTDASLKTYSTPIALGFPHRARRGQHFRQSVEVRIRGASATASPDAPATIVLGGELRPSLPSVGLGASPLDGGLDRRSAELLGLAGPDHLRFEVHAGAAGPGLLRTAVEACARLGAGLELALFVGEGRGGALEAVAAALCGARLDRVLVYPEAGACSDGELVRAVRPAFAEGHPTVPVLGGTNLHFADLNRTRPDPTDMDGFSFPVTPQAHDRDDRSVMENAEAQANVVRAARALAGPGRRVAVSPITLRPRFNAFATRPPAEDPAALPSAVDPRQARPFAAAWTVASLKHLAEAGADSVTYYETVGAKGLLEAAGSEAFPVYWVFRELAGWHRAAVVACESSAPQEVAGLALRMDGRTRVLLASLSSAATTVSLALGPAARPTTIAAVGPSGRDPARRPVREGRVVLGPYEVVSIEC